MTTSTSRPVSSRALHSARSTPEVSFRSAASFVSFASAMFAGARRGVRAATLESWVSPRRCSWALRGDRLIAITLALAMKSVV